MTRIQWDSPLQHLFEAGVDQGVLYVDGNPGVPWVGLTAVSENRAGGEPKARYQDGVKISNHASLEHFEGTVEAFTYPLEFEVCDGIVMLQQGLRATRQRRRPFSMSYRTKVGNALAGIDFAYKIHILYNLHAEPSDRKFPTLGERTDPTSFSWNVTARPERVVGLIPTAHFIIDSRSVPTELLSTVEDMLYGTSTTDPELPSAGELIFLFDSFEDFVYDAGGPLSPVFLVHDAGAPDTPVTLILDGGEI
jgi:hypothetical protein